MHELYKKYRPKTLDAMVGQVDAVRILKSYFAKNNLPHCLLFSGPSGTGKTTLARIVKTHLKASDTDFKELNAADFKGIDTIREIRRTSGLKPLGGGARVWLLDEAHKLTKDAQHSALKLLEDTHRTAYFILATTEPEALLETVRNRCTIINLKAVPRKSMVELVTRIAAKEKFKLHEEVMDRLLEVADGSPRKALVLLDQIVSLESREEQLDAIMSTTLKSHAMQLVNQLLPFKGRGTWPEVVKILKNMQEDPETVRHIVLGCAKNALLSSKGPRAERAFLIVQAFRDNFYDSKMAGLVAACYEVFNTN